MTPWFAWILAYKPPPPASPRNLRILWILQEKP